MYPSILLVIYTPSTFSLGCIEDPRHQAYTRLARLKRIRAHICIMHTQLRKLRSDTPSRHRIAEPPTKGRLYSVVPLFSRMENPPAEPFAASCAARPPFYDDLCIAAELFIAGHVTLLPTCHEYFAAAGRVAERPRSLTGLARLIILYYILVCVRERDTYL